MNLIYDQIKKKEEIEVAVAVHKFVDAVNSFRELNQHQKEQFFQNVVLQKYLSEVLNNSQYKANNIY